MYCLWLNGKKISTLDELKKNYEPSGVEMYFLGGSLTRWLELCGETEIAEKIKNLDPFGDIKYELAKIFGYDLPQKIEKNKTSIPLTDFKNQNRDTEKQSKKDIPVFSSFYHDIPNNSFSGKADSFFESSSYKLMPSSLNYSSFFSKTFFSSGSYNFLSTSFSVSSFHEFEFEFKANSSFSAGSFGSFLTGSESFVCASFLPGSFKCQNNTDKKEFKDEIIIEGKKECNTNEEKPMSDEEKIRLNLSACPLNRFGYGIHLI